MIRCDYCGIEQKLGVLFKPELETAKIDCTYCDAIHTIPIINGELKSGNTAIIYRTDVQ